jgi:hypothetical protein
MKSKRRAYWLKPLGKKNVQRSLQGAASRSFSVRVRLLLITKTAVLPDKYEQIKILTGGTYIEAYSEGVFVDDYLKIIISGFDSAINAWFVDNAWINLFEIARPISVSYMEMVASDPEEKHCCLGWNVCGGQCLCEGCPASAVLEVV